MGEPFSMLRLSIRKNIPFALQVGEFTSWRITNPKVANPLKIQQVDVHAGQLWLVAKNPPPRTATHVLVEVQRGAKTEKLGLVLVCED
jgi:hypothetical protein